MSEEDEPQKSGDSSSSEDENAFESQDEPMADASNSQSDVDDTPDNADNEENSFSNSDEVDVDEDIDLEGSGENDNLPVTEETDDDDENAAALFSDASGDESDDDDDDFDLESLEMAAENLDEDDKRSGPIIDSIVEYSEEDIEDEVILENGYNSSFLNAVIPLAHRVGSKLENEYDVKEFWHPDTAPVVKDKYSWEHFKIEYYYTDYDYEAFEGVPPTAGEGRFEEENADESGVIQFDEEEHLGFSEDEIVDKLHQAGNAASELQETVDNRTVNVSSDIDEDEFFSTHRGSTTVVNRYDMEKQVPMAKKSHFEEVERYWVNEPFAFVIIFRSSKENETKYYVIEPYLTPIEENVVDFLVEKLRNTIKYAGEGAIVESEVGRAHVIEREAYKLLERYGIHKKPSHSGGGDTLVDRVAGMLSSGESGPDSSHKTEGEGFVSKMMNNGDKDGKPMTDGGTEAEKQGFMDKLKGMFEEDEPDVPTTAGHDPQRDTIYTKPGELPQLAGISSRPEGKLIEEDSGKLNQYQVEKILYFLKRNFIGYERIDPIKNDINVEDISCDGYNSPVFVYHTDYEQIISNVYHGDDELDEFVVKLAQRSGKGISKRQPQVDTTLPDGSRAQLTLGQEVSDHGTNYTIRQFKDVPFTPIDLINWNTFSLDQMAFLWLCIENHKSLIFAGGTASGKTTSLNAVSLFIPSNSKIVSIEDTREVELPQRNWIASVTRPSFSDDEKGDVDEFDLLEAALRQRPDYIVMGEIRGEEGRTLFQVMSTGHTTYTTFHADSVGEVLKRFTTEPINVSKTMFTALDLVSIQTQTRVNGSKVRRSKSITEVNDYSAENDEINVKDVYQWQAETDHFMKTEGSSTLEKIKFDRGWSQSKLDEEIMKREVVLAYLIKNELNTYTQVAATFQAFINDPETILALMSDGILEDRLEDLREMESVLIDIDPEKEAMVPRPQPNSELEQDIGEILDDARDTIFAEVPNADEVDLSEALSGMGGGEDEEVVVSGDDDGGDEDYGIDELVSESNDSSDTPQLTGDSMFNSKDDEDLFSFDGDDDEREEEEETDDEEGRDAPDWL